MEKIYINTYLKGKDSKYYSASTLIRVTEDIFEKNIKKLKKDIDDKQVNVNSRQIELFLDERYSVENPEVKKRIRNPKKMMNKEEMAQYINDTFTASRYSYDPYTLKYFIRYTDIVRDKALLLLDIIHGIGHKETDDIKGILEDLDIVLDKDGRIMKSDIIRLLVPTICNINMLEEKVNEANNLSTYLTCKISYETLLRNDLTESEIYPYHTLQIDSLMNDLHEDNVKLTENQKRKILEGNENSKKILSKILTDIK